MYILLDLLVFIVMLTLIVVMHEGGHALAARCLGARVTEFFIGMPWGPEAARTSRRTGIRYGATLALLGGYTRIAGMVPCEERRASLVLALVNARGRVTIEEVARALDCEDDPEEACAVTAMLVDWGSIREVWPAGERHGRVDVAPAYETVARDARGLTVRDRGHDSAGGAWTAAGEPFFPPVSADAFFMAEAQRTYQGLSVPRRLVVLVAGVACNLLCAFLIFALFFMLHGVASGISLDVAYIEESSAAAACGMQVGDRIVAFDGSEVATAGELSEALDAARERGGQVGFAVERAGQRVDLAAAPDAATGLFGFSLDYAYQTFRPADAARLSLSYIGAVAGQVASLLVPSQAPAVLQSSAGVVGIASLTQHAVASGPWAVLLVMGVLSLSLGWMNLLPIPPLDGGKVVIELIQGLIGRPLSTTVQGMANLAGMALLLLLFVFMVVQDVSRIAGM